MGKKIEKLKNEYLMDNLNIDQDELKKLKKRLEKIQPRSDRGVETLFRLLSKNQYTLNTMIDRKSNILISMNAIILSIIIGTVLNQLDSDPHLIYPAVLMLLTNLFSIGFAVVATRPELKHGERKANNLMFYGNFNEYNEEEYVAKISTLMVSGDELYKTIAKDTYHLGIAINRKFKLLRNSFTIFLIGIILSVLTFVSCHLMF